MQRPLPHHIVLRLQQAKSVQREEPLWSGPQVTFDERETKHRVIIGEEYYAPLGLTAEAVVERVFAFLLMKKIPRHTEGARAAAAGPGSIATVPGGWSACTVPQDFPQQRGSYGRTFRKV